MLTDEERSEIIFAYMHDDSTTIYDMCKAIERAVLAKAMQTQDDTCGCSDCEEGFSCSSSKAMPIPKQEPVEKMLTDMKDQQQNAWLAVCRVLDEVNPEWLKFGKKGTDCAVEAIRSLSQPAQAAAMPDEPTGDMISAGIEAMNRGLGLFGDNHAQIVNNIWEDMYAEALSASPKPE